MQLYDNNGWCLKLSQQGISIVSLGGTVKDMGDLEFIQEKVLSGDYFQVSGDINTLGSSIESNPIPVGKTAFLIEAKIVITGHELPASVSILGTGSSTVRNMVEASLKLDDITKDETNLGFSSFSASRAASNTYASANAYGTLGDGRFDVLGLSLVGDGVKKISIENILDNGNAFASFSYYLV